jgi:hypothetical protein
VTTTDGVRIGGSVDGQGPPRVLRQGVIGDGDLNWHTLLPYLTARFSSVVESSELAGVALEPVDTSEVERANLGLGSGGPGREAADGVPGDPDGSTDADAGEGVWCDEFVKLRRGAVEVVGGLGDGQ